MTFPADLVAKKLTWAFFSSTWKVTLAPLRCSMSKWNTTISPTRTLTKSSIFLPNMQQASSGYGATMLNYELNNDASSIGEGFRAMMSQNTFSGNSLTGGQSGNVSGMMFETYDQSAGALGEMSGPAIYKQSYPASGSRMQQQPEGLITPGSDILYSSQSLTNNGLLSFDATDSQSGYQTTIQSFHSPWQLASPTATEPVLGESVSGPPLTSGSFSYPRNSCSTLGESVAERGSPGEYSDSDNDPSLQVSADDEVADDEVAEVEMGSRKKQMPKRRRLEDGINRKYALLLVVVFFPSTAPPCSNVPLFFFFLFPSLHMASNLPHLVGPWHPSLIGYCRFRPADAGSAPTLRSSGSARSGAMARAAAKSAGRRSRCKRTCCGTSGRA
jgi:hypothetical protein